MASGQQRDVLLSEKEVVLPAANTNTKGGAIGRKNTDLTVSDLWSGYLRLIAIDVLAATLTEDRSWKCGSTCWKRVCALIYLDRNILWLLFPKKPALLRDFGLNNMYLLAGIDEDITPNLLCLGSADYRRCLVGFAIYGASVEIMVLAQIDLRNLGFELEEKVHSAYL